MYIYIYYYMKKTGLDAFRKILTSQRRISTRSIYQNTLGTLFGQIGQHMGTYVNTLMFITSSGAYLSCCVASHYAPPAQLRSGTCSGTLSIAAARGRERLTRVVSNGTTS